MKPRSVLLHPLIQYPAIFALGAGAYCLSYATTSLVPPDFIGYNGIASLSLGSLAVGLGVYGLIIAALAAALRLLGLNVTRSTILTTGFTALTLGLTATLLIQRTLDFNPYRLAASGALSALGHLSLLYGFLYVLTWLFIRPASSPRIS